VYIELAVYIETRPQSTTVKKIRNTKY